MRRFWNSVGPALFASAWVLAAANTFADQSEDEALIHTGLELRRAHRDAEALALFQRAYAIRATPRARAQIALAEQSLGQWLAAEADLRAALESSDGWVLQHRDTLQSAQDFVSAHLGWLTVSSNVQGARIAVNGAVVGAAPMKAPLRVVVGTAPVHVEADGYVPADRSVRVESGEHATELVELVPEPPRPAPVRLPANETAPGPPRPATAEPTRPMPWAALSGAALGVAGITVGTIYGIEVLADKAARDQHCSAGRCDSDGLTFDDSARRSATVSTVAFAVGAAALVASAWLFWRTLTPARPVAILPVATSSYSGVSAGGVW
jgi:hypothetical protein